MSSSVAAVVVTFNRKLLLVECIEALLAQTYPLSKIYIIDNASTDGTRLLLEENGYTHKQLIEYVSMPENTGGAGGFYEGIRRANRPEYDWIWVMDDDVAPNADCLSEMLKIGDQDGCKYDVLQPDRLLNKQEWNRWRYGTKLNFTNPFLPWTQNPVMAADYPGENVIEIICFPFEGPMFKRKVVEHIGNVERRFFITYDDADYSMRVIQAGFKIGLVPHALMLKKMGFGQKGLSADFKLYYDTRNSIIFERKYSPSHVAIARSLLRLARLVAYFGWQGTVKRRPKLMLNAYKIIFSSAIDAINFKTNERTQ